MAATTRASAAGGSSSGTSDRTATLVPAVGDLWVVFCYVSTNTNDTPTCSDNNGGSYDRIDVANCVTATFNYRLSCFVRTTLFTNTTSTVVTVATGSNTSGCVVPVAISGMFKTGTSAIRSKGLQNNQAAGTAAPVLNQTSLTGNLTIVAHGSADTTTTPPTNWVEAQDTGQINEAVCLEVATRASGFAGTTITFGAASSTTFCSMALELDTDPIVRVTDSTLNNWLDDKLVGHGLVIPPDDLNAWADDRIVTTTSPELTINEWDFFTLLDGTAGEPISLSGDLGNRWQDSITTNLAAAGGGELTINEWDYFTLLDDFTGDLKNNLTDGSTTASLLGYEIFVYGQDLNNWADDRNLVLGTAGILTLNLSDTLNNWLDDLTGDLHPTLCDGTATTSVLSYEIFVYNQDLNNWNDVVAKTLASPGGLTLNLSDNTLNNWSDSLRIGYGLIIKLDTLTLADAHNEFLAGGAGITLQVNDNTLNNWDDRLRIGYGLQVNDSFTLTDARDVRTNALTLTLSDNLNVWNDSLKLGYGFKIPDSFNLTDGFQKSLISGGFAVWQNLASVTLNAADLASVTFLLQNTGSGDVMHEDTEALLILTEDTGLSSILYEDTDSAAIKHEDTDTV